MTVIDIRTLTERERESLLLETYLEVEQQVPRKRTIVGLLKPGLKYLGAVQLGLMVAAVTVFLIFVVTRMMFHLDLSRYFLG